MFIQDNVPLQAYSTMRLGGQAAYLSEVNEHSDITDLVMWAENRQLPILMVGDGSNIVWRDEGFAGLVLVNRLMGFESTNADENTLYLTIGAGENWDSVVERSVAMGYNGIAELSLIPGTAGATPVQNVGAYGREISDTLVTLEAYDLQNSQFVTIPASDCAFGYRTSRFKTKDKGRFLITAITLLLTKYKPQPPFYSAVQQYFTKHQVDNPTANDIRQAVIAIRSAKLPDVKTVANTGSFFGNPIISQESFSQFLADNPLVKYWHTEDNRIKLSAAWLIEQAGFKEFHDQETGMATWPKQPLVLINEHAGSTADLLRFKQKIVDAVQKKFNITLMQEPELLPDIP
jgi:UDP-N-acetylmuramate dehydrogenase